MPSVFVMWPFNESQPSIQQATLSQSRMTFLPNVLPSARVVQPKAGMLILFPSYLQHNVRMYRGDTPRICVPFNAHLHTTG